MVQTRALLFSGKPQAETLSRGRREERSIRSNNSACKASWAFLEDRLALDFKQALESLEGSGPVLVLALDTLGLV